MQQFTVPQFIDVEDKIIGPVTTRQFIIILATGLLIFILYKLLVFTAFIIFGLLLFGIGGTVAFLRINGQPFHFFLLNLIQTSRRPRLKIWDKELTEGELAGLMAQKPPAARIVPARKEVYTSSRLSEIALTVDTGGVYTPEM